MSKCPQFRIQHARTSLRANLFLQICYEIREVVILVFFVACYAPEVVKLEGFTLIKSQGTARGASMISLRPHLARRVMRCEFGDHYAIASLASSPPVILFSFHAPQPQFSLEILENSLEDMLSAFQSMSRGMRSKPLLLGGADLNCQFSAGAPGIGPWGAGERPHEVERARLIGGFLARAGVICISSYHDHGPTRVDRSGVATSYHTATLDYFLASRQIGYYPHFGRQFPFSPVSDHHPLCATVVAKRKDRNERRDLFGSTLNPLPDWEQTLPTTWQPKDPQQFRDELKKISPPMELADWPKHLIEHARPHTKWQQHILPKTIKLLWRGLRRADCPTVRRAYQIQIWLLEKERRTAQRQEELVKWASGNDWSFQRTFRTRQKLHIPSQMSGVRDRTQWGAIFQDYFDKLYQTDEAEITKANVRFAQLQAHARLEAQHSPPLVCCPTLLRDILADIKPRKAAGDDHVPSSLLKQLPFSSIQALAGHFSSIANDHSESGGKPDYWAHAMIILLPKVKLPKEPKQYRPVALLSQIHKLYCHWLVAETRPSLLRELLPSQHGFRWGFQATEVTHGILKILEQRFEWQQPTIVTKTDLQRAFDSIYHSAVFEMLQGSQMSARFRLLLARELRGTSMTPTVYNLRTPNPVKVMRGVRQGAVESALLFNATAATLAAPLRHCEEK